MPSVNTGLQNNLQSNVPGSINAQNVVGAAHQVNNGEVPSATDLLNTSPNNMQANAANLNFTNPGQLNKAVLKTG